MRPAAPRSHQPPRGIDPSVGRVLGLVAWLAAILAFSVLTEFETMEPTTIAILGLACFLPAALLSLGLALSSAIAALHREADALRQTLDNVQAALAAPPAPSAPQLDAPRAALPPAVFFSHRSISAGDGSTGDQPSLRLSPVPARPDTMPPLPDAIRALHFPKDAEDTAGFDATRAALTSPRLAPLLHAAQTVLSGLAEEGIYMDDLQPDRARPEVWRAFAEGARGAVIAPLGGIHDRSCRALTIARMRADPEFRAAVHLFLREFDRVFAELAPQADDSQITALADTRTARAFMLLGRVTGVFAP